MKKNHSVIKAAILVLALLSFPALAYNDVSTHARKMASIQASTKEKDATAVGSELEVKYKKGDCIVSISASDPWHGEYAWVVGFGEIAGYSGDNYLLLFPSHHSKESVFGKDIEHKTQSVHDSLCEKAYADAVRGDKH